MPVEGWGGSSRLGPAKGFSLVELLVVVAILCLLAAILFPLLGASLRQSKLTADVEHLRQIGVAASLYAEEAGAQPLAAAHFKGTPIWGSSLWQSGLDGSRAGTQSLILDGLGADEPEYLRMKVPFKVSYVGCADLFWDREQCRRSASMPRAGWLVHFLDAPTGGGRAHQLLELPFFRLNYDGSVVRRPSQRMDYGFLVESLFADYSDEDKRRLMEE